MDCCAKGDKCSYMHSEFPCKFYHAGLSCAQGENCKFAHGKPLSDGRYSSFSTYIDSLKLCLWQSSHFIYFFGQILHSYSHKLHIHSFEYFLYSQLVPYYNEISETSKSCLSKRVSILTHIYNSLNSSWIFYNLLNNFHWNFDYFVWKSLRARESNHSFSTQFDNLLNYFNNKLIEVA